MLVAQWLSSLEVKLATQVQLLNEAVCISRIANIIEANILEKDMNQTILLSAWVR